MADILNQNGLSNGSFNQPGSASSTPASGQPGGLPQDLILNAQKTLTSVGSLHYPSDLPKYYMGFHVFRYSRDSLMAVGLTDLLNTVCLPFPDQMVDTNQVAYNKIQFSATVGNIVNSGFEPAKKIGNNIAQGKAGLDSIGKDDFKSLLTNGVVGAGIDATKVVGGQDAVNVLGAVGYTPNYFLTVVLDGPQYKSYTCSWTMAPRNAREAADLTQIIRVFKDAQAPGLALGGALFSFPRVFMNYYAPNRGHLYQFKPSVLVNFTVNYTPGGMPSMKQAQQATGGWNAPTALRISATFLELEFWLRGDFGDAGPNANPNQDGANDIRPQPGNRDAK